MPDERKTALTVCCRGLVTSYGSGATRVTALRGADLDVHEGELLMLVGPSGCGKTTLISTIAAILDQDEGYCEVLGREPRWMGERERIRFRGELLGFVFQAFNLLPALTARENVALPLLLNGVPARQAMGKAQTMLQSVKLGRRGDARPVELSGGEQQRIAVARALVHDPRLVLCDEPTSNLDHETGREVMGLLRGLARNPERSLIVVTHDLRMLGFADRVAHMDDGRIVKIESGAASADPVS